MCWWSRGLIEVNICEWFKPLLWHTSLQEMLWIFLKDLLNLSINADWSSKRDLTVVVKYIYFILYKVQSYDPFWRTRWFRDCLAPRFPLCYDSGSKPSSPHMVKINFIWKDCSRASHWTTSRYMCLSIEQISTASKSFWVKRILQPTINRHF